MIADTRARAAKFAKLGKRVGYLAMLVGIVGFIAALATNFATWAIAMCLIGMIASCVVLPIPIVISYGVRAAAREDRERVENSSVRS